MKNKKVITGLATAFLFIVAIFNIKEYKSDTITSGLVNYNTSNFKTIAMYKNDGGSDEEITTMPESGYTINTEKSYCTVDNINKVYNKMYTNDAGNHIITGLNKDSKCYIYFDKTKTAGDTILGNVTVNEGTAPFYTLATTDEGVYKGQDGDGDSYYFRGAVENNYVKFANKYWRIIRINGDGTIRIIYDGESARANGSKLTVDTSAFNTSYNDNMYVGLKYTSGQVHGTGTKSTILGNLEIWYNNNLASYASKIDLNAGFCGDRTPSTSETASNNSGGIGTTDTYYGAYIRLVTNKSPILTCSSEDLYTVTSSSKGNKSLLYPIGLITADEVSMAGCVKGAGNKKYYLFTEQTYWTMTPYYLKSSYNARIFTVAAADGDFGLSLVNSLDGMRPVINLKSDIKLIGTGTMTDPYVVA